VTAIAQKLIDHANKGGGQDNITAVILRVQPDTTDAGQTRAQELNRKVEVLRQMPLFRHLTYKEILRVLSVTKVVDFNVGDEILREGAPGDDMFILLKGKVRLHKDGALVTYLGPGAHLGEMALVTKQPRSVSAAAEDRTRALVLRRQDFNDIIRNEPRLSVKLLWSFVQVLAQRLRKTTADLTGVRQELPDVSDETMFDE
jgi:CRP-like cAMP-binding protein